MLYALDTVFQMVLFHRLILQTSPINAILCEMQINHIISKMTNDYYVFVSSNKFIDKNFLVAY